MFFLVLGHFLGFWFWGFGVLGLTEGYCFHVLAVLFLNFFIYFLPFASDSFFLDGVSFWGVLGREAQQPNFHMLR